MFVLFGLLLLSVVWDLGLPGVVARHEQKVRLFLVVFARFFNLKNRMVTVCKGRGDIGL